MLSLVSSLDLSHLSPAGFQDVLFERDDECNIVPSGYLFQLLDVSILNGMVTASQLCLQTNPLDGSFAVKANVDEIRIGPLVLGAAMANICPVREREPILCGEDIQAPMDGPTFELSYKTTPNPPFSELDMFLSTSISLWSFRLEACAVFRPKGITINTQLSLGGSIKFLVLFDLDTVVGRRVELLARLDIADDKTFLEAVGDMVEEERQKKTKEFDDANDSLQERRQDLARKRAELQRTKHEFDSAVKSIMKPVKKAEEKLDSAKSHCASLKWYKKGACYAGISGLRGALKAARWVAERALAGLSTATFQASEVALYAVEGTLFAAQQVVNALKVGVDAFLNNVQTVIFKLGKLIDIRDLEFYYLMDDSTDVDMAAPRVRLHLEAVILGMPVSADFEAEVRECDSA